ncbi:MAG: tyrosine--tRNA ligase [Bacteroidetes bacterium]|nr:MAG: tyrosine--tRNA ligase [Bacteroidota bacterium]
MKNLIKELRWRDMIHDITPGCEEHLLTGMKSVYVGFDPTADSLHVGNLIPIMMLVHSQRAGHKPFALVGGATGMIGDPSGKSEERNLMDLEILTQNVEAQKKQLKKFINFVDGENKAEMVNNYDWFKDMNLLDFIRNVGKHITINYMTAKDSVKKRLETGLSFTEFTYQLIQGYDFYWLKKNKNVTMQLGGADQWGNITTGTELIRRMGAGESYALTCPLMTKADGGKFGKTESGTIWLDKNRTSPYEFYQFWLNASDDDIIKYLKTFSLKDQEEINALYTAHGEAPHARIMQKALAEELTIRVHSEKDYEMALKASGILFGKSTKDDLQFLDENSFLSVFKGVKQNEISKSKLEDGIGIIDLLSSESGFLPSKGDARRNLQQNAISVNKEKVNEDFVANATNLINNKYILLQKGKKNYFVLKFID